MPPTPSSGPALRLDLGGDGIARITFDQPGSRANTLSQTTLGELKQVLDRLEGNTSLQGVIFASGKPGMFIAGADLNELAAAPSGSEAIRGMVQGGLDVLAGFERLPCPTVALIDGACLGGGLELALAFDYRLAGTDPKVEIGLPEVTLGLIPGWGGTQRLARVIGPGPAAELACTGESVKAPRARELGIVFDVVPSAQLADEALRLLGWSRQSGDWKEARRRKHQPVGLTEEQHSFTFAVARAQVLAKTKGQLPAPLAALDAIAAGCNRPLDEGLRAETERFIPLVGSPISRNLIALFFLRGRLQKDPGVADATVKPREVGRVGVVGAGIMGSGIAAAHLRRGVPTTLVDVAPEALQKGVAAIAKSFQGRVEIGRMTPAEVVSALALLNTAQDPKFLAGGDVVIEAVVENEQVKTDLYRKLQDVLGPDAILASNTSTISITRMAQAVRAPENFAGMHFFNPVDRMPLVEVIRGEKTSDRTVVTLVALARKVGKTPIVVRDCPGFLVNRILFPYMNEALVLLEEGAEPRAVDKAATDFGMPMGPITLSDVVGLDTMLFAGRVVNEAYADRAKGNRVLPELVKAGRLGQKTGAGFYSYAKGSRGADDPFLAALLDRLRTGKRDVPAEEITDRLFLAMLVEASRTLEEGIVRDPGEVDMGLLLGIGFPAFRGGILRWADTLGLATVLAKLEKYAPLGKRFEPTESMRRLAAAGKGFFSR
jgi:3-hydroxyacyl-CoA dehydrogenase/enoyl-CoA hydratase/3-hydroxybutyryl-CoA epimerase/3-hydroxyacyl-CoA dehydrogenase/enoyl-CoA hydratase/3-hydroxybutyryl-CoA epimerase/enoyl-CoA isomerase